MTVCRGVVHVEFLGRGHTIDQTQYDNTEETGGASGPFSHRTSRETQNSTKAALVHRRPAHGLYSLDLALCDFLEFKEHPKYQTFGGDAKSRWQFANGDECNAMPELVHCLHACVDIKEDYVKK